MNSIQKMANLGLIAKAVENLRSLQIQETLEPDHEVKKKEKIANCLVLSNGISLLNVKAAPQVLNLSIETLLCLCDDSDSDVRTVADECLNKIIRAVADSYVLKVQLELYKEIKRNGAARCLRAALSRFGLLSHMIRPVKAKVFASQLTPCIIEIAKRKEDIVVDTLSQSLPLIFKTLGHYIPDKDIQVLLKSFFQNVISSEAIVRRASANMILTVCLNCRKPQHFINFVMEHLIDMLFHVAEGNKDGDDGKEERLNTIFGVFSCLRVILPYSNSISNFSEDFNEDHILDHYICTYELCLFFAKFYTNHNVINAALETLVQLLQSPHKNVVGSLLSKEGISHRINKLNERKRQWSSKISLSMTMVSEDLLESTSLLESDITDIPEIAPKVEKWMTQIASVIPNMQKAQNKIDELVSSQIIDTKELEDYSGLVIGSLENEDVELESNASSDVGKFDKPIDTSLPSCLDLKEEELDDTAMSVISTHELSLDQFMIQRSDLPIGSLMDCDVSLRYCCRLLASSFLLAGTPGQLMPDKLCRVSVKSLALTCLGHIFRLYPEMLSESLIKDPQEDVKMEDQQLISDVLMFAEHSDPQIRGNTLMLVGYFLQGMFAFNKGCFKVERPEGPIQLDNLIRLVLKGLEDESATTCRQTLTALDVFLSSLLESEESNQAISILKVLPSLEKNPYFLVKIKLVEVVSELPYITIEHVCGDSKFQNNMVNVVVKLLGDTDQRVRKAASNAMIKMIPSVYYKSAHEDAVTRKASQYAERYLSSAIAAPAAVQWSARMEHKLLIDSLVSPYDALFAAQANCCSDRIDEALSRLLRLLADRLLVLPPKYLAFGCCEALSGLSESYLTTLYPRAWDCLAPRLAAKKPARKAGAKTDAADNHPDFSSEPLAPLSGSLFSQAIVLLSSSPLSLDLLMHRHLLLLAGNLASGIACSHTRPKDQQPMKSEAEPTNDSKYWAFFKDKQISRNMEQLLIHVLRVLNIFQHVVEDLPSPTQSSSKSSLASLPSGAGSLSPRRKLLAEQTKSKSSEKGTLTTGLSSDNHQQSQQQSQQQQPQQHRMSFRLGGKDQHLGSLSSQPHYLRLYELLRAAHSNYQVTLEPEASEQYVGLLNAALRVLSQVLEVASLSEAGRVAEELLHYLQSTVLLSSTATVQCVRQLLKCLFGTNLLARWPDLARAHARANADSAASAAATAELQQLEPANEQGFYEQCFQRPARLMVDRIKAISDGTRACCEPDTFPHRLVSSLQRKEERKVSSILKILGRNTDHDSVHSFIRLFEPLVIKSLIQYTISNCVPLQCQVLMLLSQLIELHINYCLMDSDKIFIGFIMKHFEFIEEGHISQTEQLLPKIFDFLVRLSHEKYHSKLIIGVPKIIQLCDGLMASGQPPLTHCIPALVTVVEELFLGRNVSANVNEEKELETTREVLMSMMLRLVDYPQVVEVLSKCLIESRSSNDGEEKWRRWSRQAMDTVLPVLASRKLRLESKEAYFALVNLFSAVSPTVFRPVDPLLKILFTMPPPIGKNLLSSYQYSEALTYKNLLEFKRWVGMVNVTILSLVCYGKEEAMLARLSDVISSIPDMPDILLIPLSNRRVSGDPLNVSGLLEPFTMPPERILSRFLFRVIGSISSVLVELFEGTSVKVLNNNLDECDENEYLIHQFTLLLQVCIHMFESGSHCKVANASMQLIQGEESVGKDERLLLSGLNEVMREIGVKCPTLTCQWTYLLSILGFDEPSFWREMIGSRWSSHVSMSAEIQRRAGMILFCDYVCENVSSEPDRLEWLLEHHVESLMSLADEPPVRELVAVTVHREPATSGLFVSAVSGLKCSRPALVKRLLQCLEGAHQVQSGRLLIVLVSHLISSKYLALSRMAAKIACRRIELLLALGKQEAVQQLSKSDFEGMMEILRKENSAKKHGALVGLLNKLATTHYDLTPLKLDHSEPFNPSEIKKIVLDQNWFLSQVKSRCCSPCVSYGCFESAWLLSHLQLDECLAIFSSENFNVKLLQECVIVGTRLTAQACQQLDPEGTAKPSDTIESTLFTAVKQNLMERVRTILQKLQIPREVLSSSKHREKTAYWGKLAELVVEWSSWSEEVVSVMGGVSRYVSSLGQLGRRLESEEECAALAGLSVACLGVSQLLLERRRRADCVRELQLSLDCASSCLRESAVSRALAASHAWVCSAVSALASVAAHFGPLDQQQQQSSAGLEPAMEDEATRQYALACQSMARLVGWLEARRRNPDERLIPDFFAEPLDSLVVSLARQPLVNSFVLVPPLVWKHGCCPVAGTGPTKCRFALFLSEPNYIPEVDVLEQFIFRVSLLGWNSRQQFEEIWMVLLGVLNVSQVQSDEVDELGVGDGGLSRTASLAVQAITNLLVQTLILPWPGNPNNGSPIAHPRDPQLSLKRNSTRRLLFVQELLLWTYHTSNVGRQERLEQVFDRGNLEAQPSPDWRSLAYGQLSVSYLWAQCSLHEDKLSRSAVDLKRRRDEALAAAALDVNSCLRFLLELYASWMSPGGARAKLAPRLLHEVVGSLLLVSDLFVERSQFHWMLESCIELAASNTHHLQDDALNSHLVVAVCKASAVLTPLDIDTLDKVKKLIEPSLKSGSLSVRIAALHGLLYLLQSAVLANCEETMALVHPLAIQYIQRYIGVQHPTTVSSQSEQHQCLLLSLVFFLLEHAQDSPLDVEAPEVLELILSSLSTCNISTSLHRMLLQGLERLVATKSVIGKVSEQVIKTSIERLRQTNPRLSLPALQLFVTCMYTDAAERFNQPELEEPLPDIEPEILVRSIERSSAIFDKIKKAYPVEVKILCAVLSEVLVDFFPPLEILTKVIGEFLSPQQPHPRLMSAIVFKVCERACNSTQLDLLQTWVVFSIQNFIQSLPLIMSTWCLSCFFISCSTNPWLRALFPHVQSRIGKYEYEDKKILCLAAYYFYSELSNESQKSTFIKTFEDAAKIPGSPFADILACF